MEVSPAEYAAENARLAACSPMPVFDTSGTRTQVLRSGASLRLPYSFASDPQGGESERWSDAGHASIEIWRSREPEEGMATSGPKVSVGEISQCTLRIAGAFAKMYTLWISSPDGPDTTYMAILYAYPRAGLAFNISIEAPRLGTRDSLIALASELQLHQ